MAAYFVMIREETTDAEVLAEYGPKASLAAQSHLLKPLAIYGALDQLEGDRIEGAVIIEFPDMVSAGPGTIVPPTRQPRSFVAPDRGRRPSSSRGRECRSQGRSLGFQLTSPSGRPLAGLCGWRASAEVWATCRTGLRQLRNLASLPQADICKWRHRALNGGGSPPEFNLWTLVPAAKLPRRHAQPRRAPGKQFELQRQGQVPL